MKQSSYHFTLKGFWQRCRQEYLYFTRRPWSLKEVGIFWDSVEDYDGINETLYPHERRFSNSYELAAPFLPRHDYRLLDIQSRSGKPTEFWHQKGRIREAVCVDFSDKFINMARTRHARYPVKCEYLKIDKLPLPLADQTFDFICSYETIEHVCDYRQFIAELSRVLEDKGIMIITCPSVAWEWVHWLTAALNINHSEGPHRFLRRYKLLNCFKSNGLTILRENATIFLPFNKPQSIVLDRFLENHLPVFLKRHFALRRTFILQKNCPAQTSARENTSQTAVHKGSRF